IAVLPFQNLSGDPEQEYLADGVVEEIIMALSRMRWLFVIARNSSFTYKGQAVDVRQVGRELGAELQTGFDSITRWFRELQYYGFIVQTAAGCLGLDGKGKAPHWRLTELGYMHEPPTRDFLRWNGVKFRPRKIRIPHPPSVRGAPQTG